MLAILTALSRNVRRIGREPLLCGYSYLFYSSMRIPMDKLPHFSTVIGIGGASCSGKSKTCNALRELLKSKHFSVDLLCMDDYYWEIDDPRHVKSPVTGYVDYDCLSSVNWALLIKDVRDWRNQGVGTNSPTAHRMLLVEGAFVMECTELLNTMDICLFLALNYQTMCDRRKARVYDPPDPPGYFDSHVWPSFQRSLLAAKQFPKIKLLDVSNTLLDDQVQLIWEHVKSQLPATVVQNEWTK